MEEKDLLKRTETATHIFFQNKGKVVFQTSLQESQPSVRPINIQHSTEVSLFNQHGFNRMHVFTESVVSKFSSMVIQDDYRSKPAAPSSLIIKENLMLKFGKNLKPCKIILQNYLWIGNLS